MNNKTNPDDKSFDFAPPGLNERNIRRYLPRDHPGFPSRIRTRWPKKITVGNVESISAELKFCREKIYELEQALERATASRPVTELSGTYFVHWKNEAARRRERAR